MQPDISPAPAGDFKRKEEHNMNLTDILKKYNFTEDRYYKVVNGTVYRNVAAGLIKEDAPFDRAVRRAGKFKVYAQHHDNYVPSTNYYLILNNIVYKAEHCDSILKELTNDLKEVIA